MRKKIKITVSATLCAVFLLGTFLFLTLLIPTTVLSVKMDYAVNHYEATTVKHRSGTKNWVDYGFASVGCGEMNCKFCEGKILHSGHDSSRINYREFVYYSTMVKFEIFFVILEIFIFLFNAGTVVVFVVFAKKHILKKKQIQNNNGDEWEKNKESA